MDEHRWQEIDNRAISSALTLYCPQHSSHSKTLALQDLLPQPLPDNELTTVPCLDTEACIWATPTCSYSLCCGQQSQQYIRQFNLHKLAAYNCVYSLFHSSFHSTIPFHSILQSSDYRYPVRRYTTVKVITLRKYVSGCGQCHVTGLLVLHATVRTS